MNFFLISTISPYDSKHFLQISLTNWYMHISIHTYKRKYRGGLYYRPLLFYHSDSGLGSLRPHAVRFACGHRNLSPTVRSERRKNKLKIFNYSLFVCSTFLYHFLSLSVTLCRCFWGNDIYWWLGENDINFSNLIPNDLKWLETSWKHQIIKWEFFTK